jgi:glycine/D-amino acid oxidase-like deaminating enzyme
MASLQTQDKTKSDQAGNRLIVVGGGMAGLFSAYHLLVRAIDAGKAINVTLITDKISAPCSAGSHLVPGVDGFYQDDQEDKDLRDLLQQGMDGISALVRDNAINCNLAIGYEIKGKTADAVTETRKLMLIHGGYASHELVVNSDSQRFHLQGYDHSMDVAGLGQVNTPQLLEALQSLIIGLGGKVELGVAYQEHACNDDGTYTIKTAKGEIAADYKPLICTGAGHQATLQGYDVAGELIYTMCAVFGPLSEADARKISPHGAMAMCNTDLADDVIWGGIDPDNRLTLGFGTNHDPSDTARDALELRVLAIANRLFDNVADKYPCTISYGAIFEPANGMPVVGRADGFDIMGGWGGLGIVAGFIAAKAYAAWIVDGKDADLQVFERLHPDFFQQ